MTKSIEEFDRNRPMKDGFFNQCRECRIKIKKPSKTNTESNRAYFQEHKHEIKERRRKRYASDMNFRLSCNLRNRLSKMLRGKSKNGSAIKDLGCSIEDLKIHLEKQFTTGMNWENYGFGEGKWNIDHIISLSSFDLRNRSEFLNACHFSNLHPLWHVENIIKSDIITT
jgi:hypothetical protein